MKKTTILSVALVFLIAGIHSGSDGIANRIPDDKILIESGISSWVPNPLVGSHNWKKFFTDEKYSSSKTIEATWYYDSKTIIKASTQKLNFKGQPMGLEGATLVWTKVVGLKPNEMRYLFYGLWAEKRLALFFGIFEKEDGTKYVEDVSEMEDIQKLAPGLQKGVFENLLNAVLRPWWKLW
jgi:hypothetical protein